MTTQNTKWEYTVLVSGTIPFSKGVLNTTLDATALWKREYKDGSTDFDSISNHGEEGWELVSTTPITYNGITQTLVFIFKRPKIE